MVLIASSLIKLFFYVVNFDLSLSIEDIFFLRNNYHQSSSDDKNSILLDRPLYRMDRHRKIYDLCPVRTRFIRSFGLILAELWHGKPSYSMFRFWPCTSLDNNETPCNCESGKIYSDVIGLCRDPTSQLGTISVPDVGQTYSFDDTYADMFEGRVINELKRALEISLSWLMIIILEGGGICGDCRPISEREQSSPSSIGYLSDCT